MDVAIGNKGDLLKRKAEWASLVNGGKVKIGGIEVNQITGLWRANERSRPSAKFEMDVTDDGDLIRYSMTEDVLVDKTQGPQHIELVWDCDLRAGATPDPTVFQVYR